MSSSIDRDKECKHSFGGKPFGKLRRWEDNMQLDLRDIGCENGRWMDVAVDYVSCTLWY
jgi:hypothetical protein